jgi:hypothetical protein
VCWRHVRASVERHFPPDLAQEVGIYLGGSDLGLVALVSQLGQDRAPWVDNHAVAIAHALLAVSPHL